MSQADDSRWQQRLENFEKALRQLNAACEQGAYSELERAGLVHIFEYSFELGWKTFRDLLSYEGYEDNTPRSTIRRAFQAGYLDEAASETWLDALDKHNLLSHTYREDVAAEAVALIKERYTPALRQALTTLKRRQGQV